MNTRILPLVVLAAVACAAPPELLKMGEACKADSDCGSKTCRRGLCTAECASQTGCPRGFDCGRAAPEDTVATCYKALWDQTNPGGFGTSCALVAGGCTSEPSPCAEGFECLAQTKCDAEAFCTKGCESDSDCPPRMFCGALRAESGVRNYCMNRTNCSPCLVDDQCGERAVCNIAPDGTSYCAPTCRDQRDCYKPHKRQNEDGSFYTYPPFEECVTDYYERQTKVCAPAGGLCNGPSPIAGFGPGELCAPCRFGFPDDCAEGLGCIDIGGERYCTKRCSIELVQSGAGYNINLASDTCPDGAFCFFGGSVPSNCGARCQAQGICTGDSSYLAPTCRVSSD